jgi:hypothetical protein
VLHLQVTPISSPSRGPSWRRRRLLGASVITIGTPSSATSWRRRRLLGASVITIGTPSSATSWRRRRLLLLLGASVITIVCTAPATLWRLPGGIWLDYIDCGRRGSLHVRRGWGICDSCAIVVPRIFALKWLRPGGERLRPPRREGGLGKHDDSRWNGLQRLAVLQRVVVGEEKDIRRAAADLAGDRAAHGPDGLGRIALVAQLSRGQQEKALHGMTIVHFYWAKSEILSRSMAPDGESGGNF